jgi:hypothetical protein
VVARRAPGYGRADPAAHGAAGLTLPRADNDIDVVLRWVHDGHGIVVLRLALQAPDCLGSEQPETSPTSAAQWTSAHKHERNASLLRPKHDF